MAQFKIEPLNSTRKSASHKNLIQVPVSLPFWDDFSRSDALDSNLWESGADVYINGVMAFNEPSYNVATLDGLDANGFAYESTGSSTTITDVLTSQPIDLAIEDVNNIYISFFYQAAGRGELPDEEDSLVLQIKTSENLWKNLWSIEGGGIHNTSQFKQEILLIPDSYFHADFQFRFLAYGKPTGPFDSWNLDYIYINSDRNPADTSYFDHTIASRPTKLFGKYTSIPASAFYSQNQSIVEATSVEYKNLEDQPFSAINYVLTIDNLINNANYASQSVNSSAQQPLERGTVSFDPITLNIPDNEDTLDSLIIRSTIYAETGDHDPDGNTPFSNGTIIPTSNDTIVTDYLLQNYYAYDDGSAEYAAGLNAEGKVAIRFALAEQDTLTHIDIHFPDIATDTASLDEITLMVWSQIEPSEVIMTTQNLSVIKTSRNNFQRVKLNAPVLGRDTLYIGYYQSEDSYVALGLDRNNADVKGEVFYKLGSTWTQNQRMDGMLMIRPVFDYDTTFVLSTKPVSTKPVFYPNPSDGEISISESLAQISILNLNGQLIYKEINPSEQITLNSIRSGIYIVQMVTHSGKVYADRLVIKQ